MGTSTAYSFLTPKSDYERAVLTIRAQTMSDPLLRISGGHKQKTIRVDVAKNCLERLKITAEDQERLSVIHVAGTKGKGSTCAFVESILRHHGYKTGMVTSPHLVEFRERIKINGVPVNKEVFTDAFWTVYQQLLVTKKAHEDRMPGKQGMILCMALYIFLHVEKVDVAIVEVGIGGAYDSTNALLRTTVCAVTSLHLDHQNELGNTVAEIAWQKAGIFKKGVPAVTMPQEYSAAMDVLMERAKEVQCPLFVAAALNLEEQGGGLSLGIPGLKQNYNAGLAVQVANVWLQAKTGKTILQSLNGINASPVSDTHSVPMLVTPRLSAEMMAGLSKAFLPGRAQVIKKPGVTYYLDGAHTVGSMELCAKWFRENADKERSTIEGKVVRALVFSMASPRQAKPHLEYLKDLGFDIAAFTPRILSSTSKEHIVELLNLNYDAVEGWNTVCEQVEDWKNILGAAQQPHADPNTPGYCYQNDGPVIGKEKFDGHICSKKDIRDEMNETYIQNEMENSISSVTSGEENSKTAEKANTTTSGCKIGAFPSTISALWWATLQKETSLEQLAKADMDAHLSQPGRDDEERYSADGSQSEKAAGVRQLEKSSNKIQGGKSADSVQTKTPLERPAKADLGLKDPGQPLQGLAERFAVSRRTLDSTQPTKPAGVFKPVEPAQPAHSTKPASPIQPSKAAKPVQPFAEGKAPSQNTYVDDLGDLLDDVTHVQVLLTGSIVMVGGALALLEPIVWDRETHQ